MSEPPIHIEGTIRGDVTGGDKTVIQRAGGDIVGRDKITRDAPPIGVAALHQLPAPPSDFVGRKSELRELSRAVQSRGLAISGLRGMGGVGKTALALKLAEQLKPHYPDAQFFIRLEGLSDAPVDPLEAIGHVIRAYEPTAQLPESLDDRRAQYLALLDGKRALLVLDDARDPAQVLPLVPPAGCLLLVTSRQFFTLPGWQARDIGLLSAAEARRLLRKIAPRIKSWADEIAKLCGYHPLALRAAGGLLAATPDLETDQFAKDLQAEQSRLTLIGPRAEGVEINIEALFNLSYAQLAPDAARVFRRLAIFPDDFDAQAGETVCDDAGHAQLSELVRRSLVEFSRKRYRLHDLARAFAGSRLRDAERADAQRRQGVHYKDILAAADDLYLAGGKNTLLGLALFDLERTNILAGQAWAAAHAGQDDAAARLASAFAGFGIHVRDLRQHPRERIAWLETALAAARRLNDRQAEGIHLGNLGNANADLGDARRANEYYEQRLVVAREVGDRLGEGIALGNLGVAYADLGEPRRAIEYCEQQLAITREIGDRRGEGNALVTLGNAYKNLGEPRRAIDYYEQALAIHREIGDRLGEGAGLGNLGIAYAALGEPRRAIEYYEQQLAIAREIGDRVGESKASWNLGLVYEGQGELDKAIALLQFYVDYEREIGHPDADRHATKVEALRKRLAGG